MNDREKWLLDQLRKALKRAQRIDAARKARISAALPPAVAR